MECVALKKVEMLKCIIDWAKESGIHLSFHGSATSQEFGSNSRVKTTNALDLAVKSCSPHIAQVLEKASLWISLDVCLDHSSSNCTRGNF